MSKNMNNACPKCGEKLSPFYMKQNCPKCGTNLLYYKMDERLKADAEQAQRETDAVKKFLLNLKASTIGDVLHIIRLVVFFLPLGTMCLPMFWAGNKNVSLITFVMNIINHGFDIGFWRADYLFAMLSIALVVVLSLLEIICSLFSANKNGAKRDIIAFCINFVVLVAMSALSIANGGIAKAGLFVTLALYIAKLVLHLVVGKVGGKQIIACAVILALVPCSILAHTVSTKSVDAYTFKSSEKADISVVTFNVASAFGTSFEDTDSMTRCQRFVDYMNTVKPSLIGTQEMNSFWLDYISKNMTDYTVYGVKRGGDSEEKNSEMNPIMWDNKIFTEVEKDTFWLSQTPNVESKFTYVDEEGNDAETGCNRICTFAVLESKNGKVAFFNTHLDNSCEEARVFGAKLICDKVDEIKSKYGDIKIVITGDFNEYYRDEACAMLGEKYNNTIDTKKLVATYQEWGYQNTGNEPIDFVFTSGEPCEYIVLDDIHDGYVSDHYGVFSSINF